MAELFSPDDVAETFFTCGSPRQNELDWLRKMGVAMAAISQPHVIGRAHVTFEPDGFFDIADQDGANGVIALLFLVSDPWDTPIDIVAWQPRSGSLASWLGRCWALGEGSIYAPRVVYEGALPIWRSPLEWLKAERRGLVILRLAAAAYHLSDVGPLLVQDAHHGVQLRPALTRSPPRIVVPSETRRAA